MTYVICFLNHINIKNKKGQPTVEHHLKFGCMFKIVVKLGLL